MQIKKPAGGGTIKKRRQKSPVKLIVLYHKSRKKSTKTGIGFLGRVYSCDEIGRIVGNWRYTLVMSPTKTAGNRAKKNTPWDYHGMSDIPGGARNLLPLGYERPAPNTRTTGLKTGKNREFLQKTVLLAIFLHNSD